MAENEEVEEVNQNKDNTKDGQKAAAALDKVTDHVEEKETEISTANIENILKTSESKREKTEEIKIKKADIDLIVREIECTRNLAQKALFESKGNLQAALVSFLD